MRVSFQNLRDSLVSFLSWAGSRHDLQYLFLFAFIFRFGYMMLMLGQVTSAEMLELAPDTIRYVNIGKGLISWEIIDEGAIAIFGPGYGVFLGTIFLFTGVTAIPVLLIQIIMSSLSCGLIYKFGKELTGSKAIGLIAGYLAAVSFTSISLANILLSDTLFFFLFIAGNLLFLRSFNSGKWSQIIASGVIIGCAILTRAIGQFWPVVMLVLPIFFIPVFDRKERLIIRARLYGKYAVAALISLLLMTVWISRNYYYYDQPVFTLASAGGPANVAAITWAELENKTSGEIKSEWYKEYASSTGKDISLLINQYQLYSEKTQECLQEHPLGMLKTYWNLVWDNVTAVNELYRAQLPLYKFSIMNTMYWYRGESYNLAHIVFSIIGMIILVLTQRWRVLVFLGVIFFYFAVLIGFTQWQGSRLFYPALLAEVVLFATAIVFIWQILKSVRKLI
ncbi:MAG: glycosyltransferase family 39 protein [candidate division Zixibacteria bacterium]|nr:glycosyltransferase family 39 protein [candidate division Zixibacteria bacterium]